MRTRLAVEGVLLAVVLPLVFVLLTDLPGLAQLNNLLYDRGLATLHPDPSPDILIVAIDERSLAEVGPWPWPRSVHARLLQRLKDANPRSVFFDVFFDSPAEPGEDAALAQAMRVLPVFLPVRLQEEPNTSSFAPVTEPIASAARGIGHANLTPDADQVARRLLASEGAPTAPYPYVGSLVVLGNGGAPNDAARQASSAPRLLAREFGFAISGPTGTYRRVPYASVLRGEVPAEFLQAKIVVVGPTGGDFGGSWPVAGLRAAERLEGVEVHANAIAAIERHDTIRMPETPWHQAWTAAPILLALLMLFRLSQRSFAGTMGLLTCVAVFSYAALRYLHIWLPPSGPVFGIAAAYVIWSWRRLISIVGYLRERVAKLNAIQRDTEAAPARPSEATDALSYHTEELDAAITRLTELQRFLSEGLWKLPIPAVVCNADGVIQRGNAAAQSLLLDADSTPPGDFDQDGLKGRSLPDVLGSFRRYPRSNSGRAWAEPAEYTTGTDRVFEANAAHMGTGQPDGGWAVVMKEVTAERRARQERDTWLRFLSHDLRSPQVNILSLADVHKDDIPASLQPLLDSIRKEVERTLRLTEGFIDLSLAEAGDFNMSEVHAASVLHEAAQDVWPYATAGGVHIDIRVSEDEVFLRADGALLTRALINLGTNAIRHSPAGSVLTLCLAATQDEVIYAVSDGGEGMTKEQVEALGRGSRLSTGGHIDPQGLAAKSRGIGFSVVRAVVLHHGGWMEGWSAPGAGTTFLIGLPRLASVPTDSVPAELGLH